jgi:hypothetical protein
VRSYSSIRFSDSVDGLLVLGESRREDSVITVGNSSEEEIEMGRGGSRSTPVRTSVNSVFTGEEDIFIFEDRFERRDFVRFDDIDDGFCGLGVLLFIYYILFFSLLFVLCFSCLSSNRNAV